MGKVAKVAYNVAFGILGALLLSGCVESVLDTLAEKAKE